MTFEEMAYKERELFAIINKTRDAQFDQLEGYGRKELRRDDFEQQKEREDALVSFKANRAGFMGPARGQVTRTSSLGGGGSKGTRKQGGGLGITGPSTKSRFIEFDKGAQIEEQAASTWTTQGHKEVMSKPSITEQQGILPPIPSLIGDKTKKLTLRQGFNNGRYAK